MDEEIEELIVQATAAIRVLWPRFFRTLTEVPLLFPEEQVKRGLRRALENIAIRAQEKVIQRVRAIINYNPTDSVIVVKDFLDLLGLSTFQFKLWVVRTYSSDGRIPKVSQTSIRWQLQGGLEDRAVSYFGFEKYLSYQFITAKTQEVIAFEVHFPDPKKDF